MRDPLDRIVLPPRPSSAAAARKFVDRAIAGAGGARDRDLGALLTSELVTNAVLYSDGPITVEIEPKDDVVRIVVGDQSDRPPRQRDVGLDATSGRGLFIVRRLAKAWGVEDVEGDGKRVWFEVSR